MKGNMYKVPLETISDKLDFTAGKLGVHPKQLHYYVFPKMYGSTSGPFGGIGGACMTSFDMEAVMDEVTGIACIFCGTAFIKQVKNFQCQANWT